MSYLRNRDHWPALALGALGLIAFLLVPNVTDQFQTFQWALIAAYAIAVVGLNILTGYSGQISLGNGAFIAVGSYTTALLVARAGWPYFLTIPVGGLLAGILGVLVGIPALRLRGIYLALATFALALSVTPVLNNYDKFTGGHVGVSMRPVKPPFDLPVSNEQWLYFLGWIVFALVFVPCWLLIRGRTGRAWMAVRDSETAATANGISLPYYKTLAFGISAFCAGVAGSLLVIDFAYVNPDSYSLTLSLNLLISVAIGGLAYVWGPLAGAILIVWLPYFAEKGFGGKPDLLYGVFLVAVVFIAPNGVAGLIHRLQIRMRGGRGARAQLAGVMEATPAEADQIST
jgi:branched-chain amino acid transport system permease protein